MADINMEEKVNSLEIKKVIQLSDGNSCGGSISVVFRVATVIVVVVVVEGILIEVDFHPHTQ